MISSNHYLVITYLVTGYCSLMTDSEERSYGT
jgi:hypothetical protein